MYTAWKIEIYSKKNKDQLLITYHVIAKDYSDVTEILEPIKRMSMHNRELIDNNIAIITLEHTHLITTWRD